MIVVIMARRELYELEGGPHCGEILWGPPDLEVMACDHGCEYHRASLERQEKYRFEGHPRRRGPVLMQYAPLHAALSERQRRQP